MTTIAPISFSPALPSAAPVTMPTTGTASAPAIGQDTTNISDNGKNVLLGMLLIAALRSDPDHKKSGAALMAELLISAAVLQTLVDACPLITMSGGTCILTPVNGVDMTCAASMFPTLMLGGGAV